MLLNYVKGHIGIPLGLTSYDNELSNIIETNLHSIDPNYTFTSIFSEDDVDRRINVLRYVISKTYNDVSPLENEYEDAEKKIELGQLYVSITGNEMPQYAIDAQEYINRIRKEAYEEEQRRMNPTFDETQQPTTE